MKQFLRISLPLIVISVVCSAMLGFTYKKTLGPIEDNKKKLQLEAIKSVLAAEIDNNPYLDKVRLATKNKHEFLELYPAKKDGSLVGVAIKTTSSKGFGGPIELIVGFYMDGRINKFKLTSHKETPGLGTKVEADKFMTQLSGLNPRYVNLSVRKDGGDVDAVTAATITSRAVLEAIEKAYDSYQHYKEDY